MGYLRVPPGEAKSPCVIIIAGNDAQKEEFKNLEEEFLVRGMATVSYDGPGQGEVWEALKMRSDDELGTMAIMDYLESRPEIDMGRIGIYGWAMGGFFSPRVAAADSRVRACVSMPVRYSLIDWDNAGKNADRRLPAPVRQRTPTTRAGRSPRHSPRETSCQQIPLPPFLIVHGGRGDTWNRPTRKERRRKRADQPQLVVYDEGDHLCINSATSHGR